MSEKCSHLRKHQFKPGVSGNPQGRRIHKNALPAAYQKLLKEVHPETGRTYAEEIAQIIIKAAAEGDVSAVMVALSNDTKNIVRGAAEKLCAETGSTRRQANWALSLFCPKEILD